MKLFYVLIAITAIVGCIVADEYDDVNDDDSELNFYFKNDNKIIISSFFTIFT